MFMTSVTLCLAPSPSPSFLLLAPREVQQGVPFKLSVSILASNIQVVVSCRLQGSGYNASSSRTVILGGQAQGSEVRGLGSEVRGQTKGTLLWNNQCVFPKVPLPWSSCRSL